MSPTNKRPYSGLTQKLFLLALVVSPLCSPRAETV